MHEVCKKSAKLRRTGMHEVTLKSAQLESIRKKVCTKCAQKQISHHIKCAKRQKKSAKSLQKVCKTSKIVCIYSAKCTFCRLMHTFEKVCTNLPPDVLLRRLSPEGTMSTRLTHEFGCNCNWTDRVSPQSALILWDQRSMATSDTLASSSSTTNAVR